MLEITFISLIRNAFKTSKGRDIFSKQCLFGYSQDSSWTTKEDLKQKYKAGGDVCLKMVLMKPEARLQMGA